MSDKESAASKDVKVNEHSVLREFYRQQGVAEELLIQTPKHRFVRLNPRFDKQETLHLLQSECLLYVQETETDALAPVYPQLVPWLREEWGFYALPGDFRLAQSPSFQSGRVYGQDVASGAAVAALLTDEYDLEKAGEATKKLDNHPQSPAHQEPVRVLDLCCAPGLKLCAMADWLRANSTLAQIVGVDISQARINTCTRVIRKYQIDPETSRQTNTPPAAPSDTSHGHERNCVRIQLCCNDGTTYLGNRNVSSLVFDSLVAEEEARHCGKRKRMNKSAKARQLKQLRQMQQQDTDKLQLFDLVLVDAECSTDGSLKHMQQRLLKGGDTKGHNNKVSCLFDPTQMDAMVELQQRLAANGFRLLRPGGTMVYSTCSLSERQNEDVVRHLLATYPDADLIPLHLDGKYSTAEGIVQGTLPGSLRFLPGQPAREDAKSGSFDPGSVTGTFERTNAALSISGGFFLAKMTKRIQCTLLTPNPS